MDETRREVLKTGGAGLLGLVTPLTANQAAAIQAVAQATRAMPSPTIRDISVIETAPGGVRLSVVKITTDQPGLYGGGSVRTRVGR